MLLKAEPLVFYAPFCAATLPRVPFDTNENENGLRWLSWELVTFLVTPKSNCVTSVEDIGLQPTPLSWSLYGIIRDFIPWPSDIVGSQAIWPPCLATTTATLYTPQHATMHQLAVCISWQCAEHTHTQHTHIHNPGLVARLWGWCVSSGSPNIIPHCHGHCC